MSEQLIDKGTHLEDSEGKVYAKHSSEGRTKPRKKSKIMRSPAEWDTLYLAYGEVVKGNLTVGQLSKITGVKDSSISGRALKNDWKGKWQRALAAQGEIPTTTQTMEKISQFQAQHPGGVDWRENLHQMFKKAGKHLKRMKPEKVLENSGRIKDLNTVAEKTYGMETKEEDSSAQKPAINIQFLMQATSDA